MNVQRHYDDEHLIEILESDRDVRRDVHLSVCSSCSETLESYRAISGVLHDESAWKAEPDPNADLTLAAIRRTAERMHDEGAAAEVLIEEVTALPRQWWAMKVAAETRFHNAALARVLTMRSEAAINSMPPDAVELARAATIAADAASEALTIGSAYRQFAYALFYTGDIPGSLQAIGDSAAALAAIASAGYEQARLDIVRTVVLTAQERYTEATTVARRAQAAFAEYGDRQKLATALSAEAYVLLSQLRYKDALPVLEKVEQQYSSALDTDARARLIGNIALCQWQVGNVAGALQAYELSAVLLESTGTSTEAARARLSIAGILASQGLHEEAKARLRKLREDFGRHGMHFEMVFAGVVMAEILLAEGSYQEVETLCRSAVEVFEGSAGAHRSQVLTALAYLQEAAVLRRATPETARHVQKYFERLPYEPNLLFAPPPLAPQ